VWFIGRFGGPGNSYDRKTLEHLNRVATKHKVDYQKFLSSIIRAWMNGSAKCDKLKIQCLLKSEDYPRFRITDSKHVITQTRVNLKLMKDAINGRLEI
jgi:predicted DNA binding CopG/RHH family protein